MFRTPWGRLLALIPLVAVVFMTTSLAQPVNAESTGSTAVVVDPHCASGGEGFAVVQLTADSQASGQIEFKVYVDGVLRNTEHIDPGGSMGVSVSLTEGQHTIQVTANGQQVTVQQLTANGLQPNPTVNIVCQAVDPNTPTVVVQPAVPIKHHKKHHHHKHHKKHNFAALPSVGM